MASGTVQKPRARANSEAARATRGGATSPSPSWQLKTKEMGPVPDLPAVTLTPADAGEPHDSPSGVTHEKEKELLGRDFNLQRRETRTPALRRTLSSPSIRHAGRRIREQPPPPPSPLPLLSVHIAPMRSGSRPTPSPFPPLLATGPRPWTAPTTHATNPATQTALRVPLRIPTGPRSTRDGHGKASGCGCGCGCSPIRSVISWNAYNNHMHCIACPFAALPK